MARDWGLPGSRSDAVAARQVEGLGHSLRFSATFNVPLALAAAVALRGAVPDPVMIAWLVVTVLVFVVRVGSWAWASRRGASVSTRLLVASIGATMSGTAWGLLPVLMIGSGTLVDFVFVGFVTAGITAGALVSLCWYLPAFGGYLAGATLPLAFSCLMMGGSQFLSMGAMTVFYFVVLLFTGHRYAATVVETLALQSAVRDALQRLDEMQSELVRARRHKWQMLGHLGHELRTPMNAILGLSETISLQLYGPLGNPRYGEYVQDIHASGRRALGMIEEILEMSVAETGDPTVARTRLPLTRLIDGAVSEVAALAHSRSVGLDVRIPADLAAVVGDEARLLHVFGAVLANAIRHTPAGGSVALSQAEAPEGFCAIAISDVGRGMTPEEIALALAPFGRVENPLSHDNEGIGLGLPLAKRMAEVHGGMLHIQSEKGRGTTVTIILPVAGASDLRDAAEGSALDGVLVPTPMMG